jgi:hypothetical protein
MSFVSEVVYTDHVGDDVDDFNDAELLDEEVEEEVDEEADEGSK